ncbi:MAG: hypothetical protein WAM60_21140 [Candidatus Promineifilaceae bacterium]
MLVLIDSFVSSVNQTGDSIRDLPNRTTGAAETPFGTVHYDELDDTVVLYREAEQNPKALAYAARVLGGTWVIGVVRDGGVERPSTPGNYIEFTSGRPTTFFETIGTGYVQQDPPYCPELRQTLLEAGAEERDNLLVLDTLPTLEVRDWWLAHDVSLISAESQPEGALCRELELCYAVLALPTAMTITEMLPDILTHLPAERTCPCDQLMATARKFGKLTADWFEHL